MNTRLNLSDRIRLLEEMIKSNPEATIRDFLIEISDIENEIKQISLTV